MDRVSDAHQVESRIGDKVVYYDLQGMRMGTIVSIRNNAIGTDQNRPEAMIAENQPNGEPVGEKVVPRQPHQFLRIGCFPCNCLREKVQIGTSRDFLNGNVPPKEDDG